MFLNTSYALEMIPKVIHYCWFGGNALSKKEMNCINSWKKFCPHYEIKRWDETNFDLYSNTYCREAYERKMWAFVSDYARFKILYDYGGVYFDTDVELIKPIDDIVERGAFFGVEKTSNSIGNKAINPGLGMGVERHNMFCQEVLDYFANISFVDSDGKNNIKTIVETVTEIFLKHGFAVSTNGKIQEIDGTFIYPDDYFAPMDYRTGIVTITNNTKSVHHYAGTWLTEGEISIKNMQYKFAKIFGEKQGLVIGNIYSILARCYNRLKDDGLIYTFRYYLKRLCRKKNGTY